MARVVGVDIPDHKRSEVALTYIFGIGRSLATKILEKANIDKNKRVADWSEEESKQLRSTISEHYKVEGALRAEIRLNIKRLVDIRSYRGRRHTLGLPVRGQQTKNNARTRKGKGKTVAGKKKVKK